MILAHTYTEGKQGNFLGNGKFIHVQVVEALRVARG
jgi:hypothetical protein